MRIGKIGLIILLSAAVALANPDGRDRGKKSEPWGPRNFQELKLTPEQTRELENHRRENSRRMRDEQQKMMKAHRALMEEMAKEQPNEATLDHYKKEILDMESDRIDAMIENSRDLKQILTKDQYEKLHKRQSEQFKKGFERPRRAERGRNQKK